MEFSLSGKDQRWFGLSRWRPGMQETCYLFPFERWSMIHFLQYFFKGKVVPLDHLELQLRAQTYGSGLTSKEGCCRITAGTEKGKSSRDMKLLLYKECLKSLRLHLRVEGCVIIIWKIRKAMDELNLEWLFTKCCDARARGTQWNKHKIDFWEIKERISLNRRWWTPGTQCLVNLERQVLPAGSEGLGQAQWRTAS